MCEMHLRGRGRNDCMRMMAELSSETFAGRSSVKSTRQCNALESSHQELGSESHGNERWQGEMWHYFAVQSEIGSTNTKGARIEAVE
jgi:hypothetical protein